MRSADTQHKESSGRRERTFGFMLIAVGALLVLGALLFLGGQFMTNRMDPQSASNPGPTLNSSNASPTSTLDLECHASGEFIAGFLSPSNDDDRTRQLLETMNTDAVTFGGWVEPAELSDFPEEVREAIGERTPYIYSVDMNWDGIELAETDSVIEVGDTQYGIIQVTEGAGENSAASTAVVITQSPGGNDPFASLTRVEEDMQTQSFIGLPVPMMRTEGEVWLPDNSYAEVVDGFSRKFVAAYTQRGADGFYLAMEMPLTDAAHGTR